MSPGYGGVPGQVFKYDGQVRKQLWINAFETSNLTAFKQEKEQLILK